MAQTIRLTITPDLEKALRILDQSTSGTLNTTELIKMAVGGFARLKQTEMSPQKMDIQSARLFYEWAKEDKTQDINNIANPENLKSFIPKPYVRAR